MRQVTTAADRIDYWIRRRLVPCLSQGMQIPLTLGSPLQLGDL
jgi:hypothetical protein